MNTKKIGNTTYKRNEDLDWEEKINNKITLIYPCCDYIDCDFFSIKKNRAEYKKEVREHKRKVHGVETIFVDEQRQENEETS